MIRVFDTPGPVTLVLRLPAGAVELTAVEGDETRVEIEPLHGGEEALEAVRVELRARGEGHEVAVEAEDRRFGLLSRSRAFRLSIAAPAGARVEATTSSAGVSGRGAFGAAEVTTASGEVAFERVEGDADVKAASGDVELGETGGRLRVQTASGDIEVGLARGEATLRSASGDVRVREARRGLSVQTASGDQRVGSVAEGEVTLQSASGDVAVGVRRGSRLWVDARSLSGETASELELAGAPGEGEEGPLVELRVQTMSGDIRVVRAAEVPA